MNGIVFYIVVFDIDLSLIFSVLQSTHLCFKIDSFVLYSIHFCFIVFYDRLFSVL